MTFRNVIYCGPFDTHEGYKGGIYVVANSFCDYYTNLSNKENLKFIPLNTVMIRRDKKSFGRLNLQSFKNTLLIKKELKKSLKNTGAKCIYYNSSAGMPLLKDLLILSKIRDKSVKKIIHIHFAEYDKILPRHFRKTTIRLLKKMDKIVFLSSNTRDEFINNGFSKEKTEVLYNFHNIKYSDIDKRNKISRKTEYLNIIFIGSLDERKGIVDLLNSLKSVSRPFSLNICGTFSNETIKDKCEKLISEIGHDKIKLCGYVSGEEKEKMLLEADILVLPSYAEGLPLVVLEGIAAGCTILTTNVGANPEIIKEENGMLVCPGDIGNIAYFIQSVSSNQLNEFAKNNFNYGDDFSIEKFTQKTISIIEGTIHEKTI